MQHGFRIFQCKAVVFQLLGERLLEPRGVSEWCERSPRAEAPAVLIRNKDFYRGVRWGSQREDETVDSHKTAEICNLSLHTRGLTAMTAHIKRQARNNSGAIDSISNRFRRSPRFESSIQ